MAVPQNLLRLNIVFIWSYGKMPESAAVVPLTCPTYLSWLYQVERCFSKIQRDVIARGIFPSTKDLDKNHAPYL